MPFLSPDERRKVEEASQRQIINGVTVKTTRYRFYDVQSPDAMWTRDDVAFLRSIHIRQD